MASLWSSFNKGKIKYAEGVFYPKEVAHIIGVVQHGRPKLVNITGQADEWVRSSGTAQSTNPDQLDLTPPFPRMWFEWQYSGCRRAVLVCRNTVPEMLLADKVLREKLGGETTMSLAASAPDKAAYFLQVLILCEEEGAACLQSGFTGFIDSFGRSLEESVDIIVKEEDEEEKKLVVAHATFIGDVLTTMNTCGTRIEPPFDSPHAQIIKPDRAPCSVWHTIHIPRFRNPPLAGAVVSPEMLERREHWVRGHRKDYRRGNGMFGRIKALVWVPEFQRGNPELGTVQQKYEVQLTAGKVR